MFHKLSEHLSNALDSLRGIGRLTKENTESTLKKVRDALLEADVALPVVKEITTKIQDKALGQKVIRSIRPGEALIKIIQDELTEMLGSEHAALNLEAPAPLIILVAGLQGSGKTTTVAKLAKWLMTEKKKSVMVTSVDVYRPAAIEQLKILAEQIEAAYFPSRAQDKPLTIVKEAIKEAKKQYVDVLILDTAGRLHIDTKMMEEIEQISKLAEPTETLLVVDSMTGQDAVHVAKTFNDQLPLTGIILTKTDGDARGGAALSMRMITGKPIKFMGVGEKVTALQLFHPKRVASRILGMGDIVSLVEEAQTKVDEKQAKKIAKKLSSGKKRFDLNDFMEQLRQMKNMGGMKALLSKLPSQLPKAATSLVNDQLLKKMEAIIQSMTPKERLFPAILNGSRKRRISMGSGTSIQDVNKLIKQFTQMQKTLKRFKNGKMLHSLKKFQTQLPPEFSKSKKPTES